MSHFEPWLEWPFCSIEDQDEVQAVLWRTASMKDAVAPSDWLLKKQEAASATPPWQEPTPARAPREGG